MMPFTIGWKLLAQLFSVGKVNPLLVASGHSALTLSSNRSVHFSCWVRSDTLKPAITSLGRKAFNLTFIVFKNSCEANGWDVRSH
ncbi:hypothetical protein CO654_30870 [Rhizobium sp. L18]|nr:hypothetical protein CO654_30870 [Rhizobium sp. L18]